jgi:hypothetical protein
MGEPGGLRCSYDSEKFTVGQFANALVSRWGDFLVESLSEQGTWIVESALLQSPLHGLLLGDVDTTRIKAIIDRIFRVVSATDPCLIYLRPDEPGEAIRRACQSRYEGLLEEYIERVAKSRYGTQRALSGFEGLLHYWNDFLRISDELVHRADIRKIIVRTSRPEEVARQVIGDFLIDCGFPWQGASPPPLSIAELSRYVGVYSRKAGDRTAEVEVRIVDGNLSIVGLAPYLWNAGERLIPKRAGIFAAASWPTEVHFQERGGVATSFRLFTSPGGRATDEVFPRLRDL